MTAAIDWAAPIEAFEWQTSPLQTCVARVVEGYEFLPPRKVLVRIDGLSKHHQAGEYLADKTTGYVQGTLAIRNTLPV